jgi:ribose-phosphate pyrophosphokinase
MMHYVGVGDITVFAGRGSKILAERICKRLDIQLGLAWTSVFPDGELIVKLESDVRGRDCFLVLSTCGPVNENMMELLIFVDCLKRASAARVTVVTPYFGYSRQDRKDEGRVPITAKLVANLITAAGADRVLAVDLHAAQIQGFFDIPMDHLSAMPVFIDYFKSIRHELGDLCLVSPDVGNVKVAEQVANLLDGELAIINKRRLSGAEVATGNLIGSVKGKTVLMFDDQISTGGTIIEAARLVIRHGATQVLAAATHAVLAGNAIDRLAESPLARLVVTNSIPRPAGWGRLTDKVVELCISPLLADAIYRIHYNQSVSALFRETGGVKR